MKGIQHRGGGRALSASRVLGEIAVGTTADFSVIDGGPLKSPELLARRTLVPKAGREL